MRKTLFITVSALLLMTSCVSKKKFLIAENGRLEAVMRGDQLQAQLVDCQNQGDELTKRVASLVRDTARLGQQVRSYQSMLTTNMSEQETLNALLRQKLGALSDRE